MSKKFPGKVYEYVVAQAMHETGVFTSIVMINNNNLFGMRHPEKRPTISKGARNGYAYYNSIEDSIDDLRLWWIYTNMGIPVGVYDMCVKLFSRKYFEADLTSYSYAVDQHYIEIKNLLL